MSQDSYNLRRFVDAQEGTYSSVLSELRSGKKTGHWMWFVFPQLRGLGHSPTSEFYAISGRDEALAYLAHPLLGSRLRECTEAVCDHPDSTARRIFGSPDDLKFRSCVTLFGEVSGDEVFRQSLDLFYEGEPDPRTIEMLS